ncbi:DUF559 domain-containing protein [Candidatus Gracilibacteria bacterium]|nr:DUF559 domain-containing protein [Candidatus Gracilibacteria bacterium]
MKILAFETSCDDTSIALFENDTLITMETQSQIKVHNRTGGVVPEVAAREHANAIFDVLDTVLKTGKVTLKDIDYIGVTTHPGLIPSLLTGTTVASTISQVHQIPILPINHIESHIFANFLERQESDISFPLVCLTVSGGHNDIYFMSDMWSMEKLGSSQDDAGGEAFDKVAKMMGLGYPGGPIVSKLSDEYEKYPQSSLFQGSLHSPLSQPFPQGEKGVEQYAPKYVIDLAREMRQKGTKEEDILWELLRRKQLGGIKFRRQHPFGRYIADFYSHELKLVVEIDGKIHEKQKEYDKIRDEIIQQYGVKILRIQSSEIYDDISSVLQKITSYIPSPSGGGLGRGLGEDSVNKKKPLFPRVWLDKSEANFSFSGLKSAVKREIDMRIEQKGALSDLDKQEISYEFEMAVTEVLAYKLVHAAKEKGVSQVLLGGGVSANTRLRDTIANLCTKEGLDFLYPTKLVYCMDNAAMVGILTYYRVKYSQFEERCGVVTV